MTASAVAWPPSTCCLKAVQDSVGPPPEGILSIERVIEHLRELIKESKRISHRMRPMALDDLGLTAAISETIRKFKEFYPLIKVDHKIQIIENEITDEIKTVLYRVVQEALNTVGKHSGAESVKVSLIESQGLIS